MKEEFAFGEKKLNSDDIKSSVYGHVLVAAAPLAAFPTAATDILVGYAMRCAKAIREEIVSMLCGREHSLKSNLIKTINIHVT